MESNEEFLDKIAEEAAKAIDRAVKSVSKRYGDIAIVFDGCIEVDGVVFYKPDWKNR